MAMTQTGANSPAQFVRYAPELDARSRTSGLRIMFRDRSRAVCVGSISQSSALQTRFQPFFHASWLPCERTSTTYFHEHHAAPFLARLGLWPERLLACRCSVPRM